MTTRFRTKSIAAIAVAVVAALSLATVADAGPGGKGKGGGKGKPTTTTTTEVPPPPPPPPPSSANEADAEFVRMMIPHHHQALVMSGLAPSRSTNVELLALAARIDAEQTVEIGTMQQWQAFNGFDQTDPVTAYQMMMQDPAMIEMMGMATQAELEQLEMLSGAAFDQLFLQLMIDHHQGAVDMCVQVMTEGQEPVLQSMANEMLTTQSTQIAQMQAMLAGVIGF
jgi:uncharacterized protein (DUF305 family)